MLVGIVVILEWSIFILVLKLQFKIEKKKKKKKENYELSEEICTV